MLGSLQKQAPTVSKSKEVWAAARITTNITAQHIEGGDHHRSKQDTSAYTSSSVALDTGTIHHWHSQRYCSWKPDVTAVAVIAPRMDSPPNLLCFTRAPSLKPVADPLGLLSLTYVPCSNCRQVWESKELTFFETYIVNGICFTPIIIRLPPRKERRSDFGKPQMTNVLKFAQQINWHLPVLDSL